MNEKLLLADLLKDLRDKCEKYNAESCSVTIGGSELIQGWDARITVAAPGMLENMGDSDE